MDQATPLSAEMRRMTAPDLAGSPHRRMGAGLSRRGLIAGLPAIASPGARLRPTADRFGEPVNVREFGAKGDGITDDSVAIQAAYDSFPASYNRHLYFPPGTYLLSRPLRLLRYFSLSGEYWSTEIRAATDFAGDSLFELHGLPVNDPPIRWVDLFSIEGFRFSQAGLQSIAAVKATAVAVVHGIMDDLFIETRYGVILDTYTQEVEIGRLKCQSPRTETLLALKGNCNVVELVDIANGGGDTDEPYVHLSGDRLGGNYNVIRYLMCQGYGRDAMDPDLRKPALVIEDQGTVEIQNIYVEMIQVPPRTIQIKRVSSAHIGVLTISTPTTGLYVEDSNIAIGRSLVHRPVRDLIENVRSSIRVEEANIHTLMKPLGLPSAQPALIGHVVSNSLIAAPIDGWEPGWRVFAPGHDLLVNGGFEAGFYGWTLSADPFSTKELVPGVSGAGMALHLTFGSSSSLFLSQDITIPPDLIDHRFSVGVSIKLEGPIAFARLEVVGAGLTADQHNLRSLGPGQGWSRVQGVVRPRAAGTMSLRLWLVAGMTGAEAWTDDAFVCLGEEVVMASASPTSLIAGVPHVRAVAPPTTGIWPDGSICWNTNGASGQPLGWRYDGTKTVWRSFGNLS